MNERLSKNQAPRDVSDYLGQLQESRGTNRDTEGLGTMAVGPIIVGRVDAINGENGKEVLEFPATGHELIQLAKYWVLERIEHDFDWFLFQSTGSGEWRWSVYIGRRLDRLYQVLGRETMHNTHEDAVALFRQRHPKITDEDWRVFTEGTEDEQEAWREKVWEEHFEDKTTQNIPDIVSITKKKYEQFLAQRDLLETIIEDEQLDDDILVIRYDPDLVTRAGYGPDGEVVE